MFIASQIALKNLKICKESSITSYSLVIGLVTYAIIYFYILFYNPDLLSVFNNFIIYIIGIDILLSAFYYSTQSIEVNDDLSDSIETESEIDLIENVTDNDELSIVEDDIEELEDNVEPIKPVEPVELEMEVVETLNVEESEQNAFEKDLLDRIEVGEINNQVKKRGRKKKETLQI
jgi:hypothetical protein